MSKCIIYTHQSTKANKTLLEIVHFHTKEVCAVLAKLAFFHFHHSFNGKRVGGPLFSTLSDFNRAC